MAWKLILTGLADETEADQIGEAVSERYGLMYDTERDDD